MRKLLQDKKGLSLDSLYPAVLTIVLVGIVLGVGVYVLTQSSKVVGGATKSVANETITTLTEANHVLAVADDCGFNNNVVIVKLTNATGGNVVPTTNYTYTAAGIVNLVTPSAFNNSNINASYTYKGTTDSASCTAFTDTSTGVGGLSSWIAVIVVVIAAAIVLGIVISSFGRRSAA